MIHRINVALSGARCLALRRREPAAPRYGVPEVEQMKLVNALCRFVKLAERDGG
jgi:hypothetical protein